MNALRVKQDEIASQIFSFKKLVPEEKKEVEPITMKKETEIERKIAECKSKISEVDLRIKNFIGESDPNLRRPKLPPYAWMQERDALALELEQLEREKAIQKN
jgi:hypothetical protein